MKHADYMPAGYTGQLDSPLPQLVKELRPLLSDVQTDFQGDELCLERRELEELAGILVDFAADIHAGLGIWQSYERYNQEFYDAPLPLTSDVSRQAFQGIHVERVRHLLWVLYSTILDEHVIAPTDPDIQSLAEAASAFLSRSFASLSDHLGINGFLGSSNEYGWDVKRKLVWLGTKSYMFRMLYPKYILEECEGDSGIGHTDDFICQQCSPWSGLGATDILAGALEITDQEKHDLRSWYERHVGPYEILSANSEVLDARNAISGRQYRIRINMSDHPFKPGLLVIGSLTPWNGEWYWSGKQQTVPDPTPEMFEEFRKTMLRRSPAMAHRCSPEHEKIARTRMADHHAAAMQFYGTDLVVYPDGLSMAADWQKELRQNWESKPAQAVEEAIRKHGLKNERPHIGIPQQLLDSTDGVGVFMNPESGKEIMEHFNAIVEGFRRKGAGLTDTEENAIRAFVRSGEISPRFVERLLDECGDESIKTSFRFGESGEGYWLEYLLRRHKGHFFRKRYPAIALV